MAAAAPIPGSALVKVEVDFTSNWNNPTAYTDVTADLRAGAGVSWDRGRVDAYQSVAPGTAGFTLNNRSRTYDPVSNANMVPARPLKITCYYPTTATAYMQFDGLVEDWTPKWTLDKDAVVEAAAVERYAALAFCQQANVLYFQESAATRLGHLADSVGWPAAARSFAATSGTLPQATPPKGSIMDEMTKVATGQGQVLYEDRNGTLTTKNAFSALGTSIGTFGDNTGLGELPFAGLELGVGGGYLYTQVMLTVEGPAWTQNAQNVVTKLVGAPYTTAKYGYRTFSRTIAQTTQADAQSAATGIAGALGAQAACRVKSMTIKPMANPGTLFPVVLAADQGSTFALNFTPPGGGSRIGLSPVIRSIHHDISDTDWTVVWNLSP
jgi:hypothetical protein